jgi:preprotein translocase subunit SecE
MALKFYKKGQGYYTRMGTALAGALISALGSYALYNKLDGLRTDGMLTANAKAWIQAGVPVVVFGVLCWAIFKLVNNVRFADFLIATEGEMKKVSWSTKKEIIASTKVVVITVFILAFLLAMVDFSFANLFEWIGVLEVMA